MSESHASAQAEYAGGGVGRSFGAGLPRGNRCCPLGGAYVTAGTAKIAARQQVTG